ncbi:MAG: hypothetical protein CMC96_12610 [Flavobacteriales bacterium]|nr:hypothetical protein [Flavobacteriales bacterium]
MSPFFSKNIAKSYIFIYSFPALKYRAIRYRPFRALENRKVERESLEPSSFLQLTLFSNSEAILILDSFFSKKLQTSSTLGTFT